MSRPAYQDVSRVSQQAIEHTNQKQMVSMARVLCTGVDERLVETRKLILEKAGHKVVTAVGETAVQNVCKEYLFDVAVIGQTISREVKLSFAKTRSSC